MSDWWFYGFVVAFLVLVIEPLRTAAVWFFTAGIGPILLGVKSLVHVIVRAHVNVIQNFMPRTRIFYELNRHRTSHTEDK